MLLSSSVVSLTCTFGNSIGPVAKNITIGNGVVNVVLRALPLLGGANLGIAMLLYNGVGFTLEKHNSNSF